MTQVRARCALLLLVLVLAPMLARAQATAGWEFPAASTYTAAAGDSGKVLGSDNAPGASITVTLPSPGTVGNTWTMGFSTGNGRGVIVNAPASIFILAGQKTLTSLSAPSDTNYEYFELASDGTNFRLATATQATAMQAGLITAQGTWTWLSSVGYSATLADNGNILSTAVAGGAVAVTLPSTPLLPNGWNISLYAGAGNSATIVPNGVSGGTLIDPSGTAVPSYTLPSTGFATVSFDGAAFRIVLAIQGVSVNTNAALAGLAAPASGAVRVTRCGVLQPFDAPCQDFILTVATCSVSGGDVGTEVALASGGCANAVVTSWLDIRQFGIHGDGTTDDTAAINAATAASWRVGKDLYLPSLQYATTGMIVYSANNGAGGINTGSAPRVRFAPGAALDQIADGNITLSNLPYPGSAPGASPGIEVDNAMVHQQNHTGAAYLFENATHLRLISPKWDGTPSAACTYTHNDGADTSGQYPCGGIEIKGITGSTKINNLGEFGPYFWHITSPESYNPWGSVLVTSVTSTTFTFVGNTCGGANGCTNTAVPPTFPTGVYVGDVTTWGAVPRGTTVTTVSAQVNGTVTLSGPHSIQPGDTIIFATISPMNPAFVTLSTSGQTLIRPNFGTMDGHAVFRGYSIAIWNASGNDNRYVTPEVSANAQGFEIGNSGAFPGNTPPGMPVTRTIIDHPYAEEVTQCIVVDSITANNTLAYGNGTHILNGLASTSPGIPVALQYCSDANQGQGNAGWIEPGQPAARPNLLLNGAFNLDQPHEGATENIGSVTEGPDGWEAGVGSIGAGTWTMNRATEGPAPANFGLRLTQTATGVNTANSSLAVWNVATAEEVGDILQLGRSNSVCQSFMARSSVAGTYAAFITNANGTRAFAWEFSLDGSNNWTYEANCFAPDAVGAFAITASISGTTLTVTAVPGTPLTPILPGDPLTGASVPANTTIVSQLTGTPQGAGTYTVSSSSSIASEGMTIGAPYPTTGPRRALLVGVAFAAGANLQIMPGVWTTTVPAQQAGVGVVGMGNAIIFDASATADVTLMKLEVSDEPTYYVYRDAATNLALAQRRYWKSDPQGQSPLAVTLSGALCATAGSATAGTLSLITPTPTMNGLPATITTQNPMASNANWRDVTGGSDAVVRIDPSTAIGDAGVEIGEQTTALTAGHNYCIQLAIDRRP